MDLQSMRGLLPFYVNGTLGPEERALVDQALATSGELKQELYFWQQAARHLHAERGHLTAQQIVAQAHGTTPEGERAALEGHLAHCPECSHLLQKTDAWLSSPGEDRAPAHDARSRRTVWKYAVAALLTLVVILVIIRESPPTPPHAPGPHLSPAPDAPAARTITSLVLTYQPLMRGTDDPTPTPLSLQEGDTLLRMLFAIPRSDVNGMRYSLWREKGRMTRVMIARDIGRSGRGETYDTVSVDVARSDLPVPHQQIRLILQEELPRGSSGLTPEEYSFEVQGQPAP